MSAWFLPALRPLACEDADRPILVGLANRRIKRIENVTMFDLKRAMNSEIKKRCSAQVESIAHFGSGLLRPVNAISPSAAGY
jgi:hypothetical protein